MSIQRIDEISARLSVLEKEQYRFMSEINGLKQELRILRSEADGSFTARSEVPHETQLEPKVKESTGNDELTTEQVQQELADWSTLDNPSQTTAPIGDTPIHPTSPKKKRFDTGSIKTDVEKFIGENLINKIGIAILILGVSVGVKYAIDHELISPLGRILMAYVFGGAVFGVAMYLKKNYKSFSAVLLSGAMAMFYFITYAAYDFYGLIPLIPTFIIMLFFTVFTVLAALHYNQQVIAHIGLVGAYSVPFLLSSGSGRVDILFGYMLVINLGILAVAINRYWKSLYYASFLITWAIYFAWYLNDYSQDKHFGWAMGFSLAFYVVFYLAFLANKFIKHEKYSPLDIVLMLSNSFLYFGAGYLLLDQHETGRNYLGLFTIGNAMIHFGVSLLLFYRKLADRNLFYLAIGLVLIFVTIAAPVQLDGNYVTVLWAFEALLLFWIGRKQKINFYEVISYVLMVLAFGSILQDWEAYDFQTNKPLMNMSFWSSVLVSAAFVGINYLNKQLPSTFVGSLKKSTNFVTAISPVVLGVIAYFTFFMEVVAYFDQLYYASGIKITGDYDYTQYDYALRDLQTVWLLFYTLAFSIVVTTLNWLLFKSKQLARVVYFASSFVLFLFLTVGLYTLSGLRDDYLRGSEYFNYTYSLVVIRYLGMALAGVLLFTTLKGKKILEQVSFKYGDFLVHLTTLWLLTSEVIHQTNMANSEHTYKLEVTILWGVYALFLVVLGIAQKVKHLRLGGMILMTVTLLKLFAYDISHMESIAKVVVFVSLGLLLLVISFLYNKFKDKMIEPNDMPEELSEKKTSEEEVE